MNRRISCTSITKIGVCGVCVNARDDCTDQMITYEVRRRFDYIITV